MLLNSPLYEFICFLNLPQCYLKLLYYYITVGILTINTFKIINSSFYSNEAFTKGGCISVANNGLVEIMNTIVKYNKALFGGALLVEDGSKVDFNGSNQLEFNYVKHIGGAIAVFDSTISLIVASSLVISENHAGRGSKLYLYHSSTMSSSSNSRLNYTNVLLMNNYATTGGTIYWIKDDFMIKTPEIIKNMQFLNNTAPYGNTTATQAIKIVGPSSYQLSTYANTATTSLLFRVYDYYDNALVQISDGKYTFNAAVSNKTYPHCSGRSPTLIR